MKKRILGLALALVMIISLLPAVTVLNVQAETVTKHIGLFGSTVTVDNDAATTEIADTYYWTTAEDGVPVAATAADAWNISFGLVDGVSTITLKNATIKDKAFIDLYPSVNGTSTHIGGTININYEGTNNISNTAGSVISSNQSNSNKPVVTFTGAEGAELNISGGASKSHVINFQTKASTAKGGSLNFKGGTVNIERTVSGHYATLYVTNAALNIEDCDFTVLAKKSNSSICFSAVAVGSAYAYDGANPNGARNFTIKNSDVTIDTDNIMGILVASGNTSGTTGTAFNKLIIEGDSDVSVTVANTKGDATDTRGGIVAGTVIVKDSAALEVKATTTVDGATMNAVVLKSEGVTAPDLTGYVGQYNMYVAEDGEPATAFAASNYFKVAFKVCTTHAGVITDCTKNAKCTNPGCKENFYTAPANAAHEADADDGDCTTGIKCKHCQVIVTEGAASHKDTRTDCAVAGTCANTGCTHAFAAGQHNPAADDGDCTTDIKCASCGKVATKGQAEHKYTDKNDTTCNNAGCTNTRTAGTTENPKTGDNTALVLVATLMVAAAAAFVTSKKFVR